MTKENQVADVAVRMIAYPEPVISDVVQILYSLTVIPDGFNVKSVSMIIDFLENKGQIAELLENKNEN